MSDSIEDLQQLTDDELHTLGVWMTGIRGPAVVDPDLPPDPDAETSEARPTRVKDWAANRLAEVVDEQNRRED